VEHGVVGKHGLRGKGGGGVHNQKRISLEQIKPGNRKIPFEVLIICFHGIGSYKIISNSAIEI